MQLLSLVTDVEVPYPESWGPALQAVSSFSFLSRHKLGIYMFLVLVVESIC